MLLLSVAPGLSGEEVFLGLLLLQLPHLLPQLVPNLCLVPGCQIPVLRASSRAPVLELQAGSTASDTRSAQRTPHDPLWVGPHMVTWLSSSGGPVAGMRDVPPGPIYHHFYINYIKVL